MSQFQTWVVLVCFVRDVFPRLRRANSRARERTVNAKRARFETQHAIQNARKTVLADQVWIYLLQFF